MGFGSNLYWVSKGASNWANASNWSASSGGMGGSGIPGSADVAIFDGVSLCVGNCAVDAPVNVSGITTFGGYSGKISQNSFDLTIGVSGLVLAGGLFLGGNASINLNGNFMLSGAAFTSTSGTMSIISGANITFSSGVFNHNNGTINLTASNNTITGNFTFYTLAFKNASGSANVVNIGPNNTLVVINTLSISGSSPVSINGGSIEARGDITLANSSTIGGGTSSLIINGTNNQTLTGQGTSGKGLLLPLTINKPTGILFLSGIISTSNDWVYTLGNVNYGNSKVVFTGTLTISGIFPPFYDVEFLGPATITIVVGNTPVVNGSVYITGTSAVTINSSSAGTSTVDPGSINVFGNITVTNSAFGGGGSATFSIEGAGIHNLTGSGVAGQGALPVVNILCKGGTLNLIGTITSAGNWIYTNGTINPGTSRMVFTGSMGLFGTHTLNDIEIFGNTPGSIYVYPPAVVTASGNLYFTGKSPVVIGTGTIAVKSDIIITNTGVNGGGNGTILINGTGIQNFTSTSTAVQSKLPNVIINKPSGSLNMTGLISATGDWTYINGIVLPNTSTVTLYYNKNITGKSGAGNMDFYNLTLGDNSRRTMLSDISVTNTLALGIGNIDLHGSTCIIKKNSVAAVTYKTGYFISENTGNHSKVSWNVGATLGSYVYPFATAAPSYIPFTFQLTAGDAGYVTISTYPTASNNTPLPVSPDPVSTADPTFDNSGNGVIDRFWQIDKSGATATATLTYTYAAAEVSGGVIGNQANLKAQRYNTTNNSWDKALPNQISNVTNHTVTESGVTLFSPRTLAVPFTPIEIKDMEVVIPNVFTPHNKDGNNDYFVILGNKPNSNLEIYNREGKRIYQSINYNDDWAGDDVSEGVYFYVYKRPDKPAFKGWVQVMK
jgi:gliding motility-associated-like protein